MTLEVSGDGGPNAVVLAAERGRTLMTEGLRRGSAVPFSFALRTLTTEDLRRGSAVPISFALRTLTTEDLRQDSAVRARLAIGPRPITAVE